MNNCDYYSCFKGKPTCKHPNDGEHNTRWLKDSYSSARVCENCKRANGGIYPSQVPRMEFTGKVDVVDRNGNVIG